MYLLSFAFTERYYCGGGGRVFLPVLYLFVVIPFILDVRLHLSVNVWTHQPGSHRRGRPHRIFFLLFFLHLYILLRCLPQFFIVRRIQPSLSLVDREVEFCVLTRQNRSPLFTKYYLHQNLHCIDKYYSSSFLVSSN